MKIVQGLALLVLVALAGCGSSSSQSRSTASSYKPSIAGLPTCTAVRRALPLPASFPQDFPLPSGLVITSSRKGYYNATVIHGVMPSRSFQRSLRFFTGALPRAGFKLTESDSEPPREGEAAYRGNGYVGRWKIHNILGCAKALTVDISATKT